MLGCKNACGLRGCPHAEKQREMIANGRVKVNGRVAKIGDKVDTKKDKITVDNKTVVSSVRSVYYMLHKTKRIYYNHER